MTKQEFLSVLQESLEGNIPQGEIPGNINFYREYFENSPKSEQAVCEELGEPRLIAKTIIDSFIASKGSMAGYYTEQARDEYRNAANYRDSGKQFSQEGNSGREPKRGAWYKRAFRVLILVLCAVFFIVICFFALNLAVRIILPIVAVCLIIKLLLDLFRRY